MCYMRNISGGRPHLLAARRKRDHNQKICCLGPNWVKQYMTHLWPVVLGLFDSYYMFESSDALMSRWSLKQANNKSAFTPVQDRPASSNKGRRRSLVSWSRFIWIKLKSMLISGCLLMTECVWCSSSYFNELTFSPPSSYIAYIIKEYWYHSELLIFMHVLMAMFR